MRRNKTGKQVLNVWGWYDDTTIITTIYYYTLYLFCLVYFLFLPFSWSLSFYELLMFLHTLSTLGLERMVWWEFKWFSLLILTLYYIPAYVCLLVLCGTFTVNLQPCRLICFSKFENRFIDNFRRPSLTPTISLKSCWFTWLNK